MCAPCEVGLGCDLDCGSCSISAGLAAQTFSSGPWSELLIINWPVYWNVLGGALAWADVPAGTSCMVKDASVAVLSVGCFTKVLETKLSLPVIKGAFQ